MDKDFEKRFVAAVRKNLTDEMIAEQMDLTLDEVDHYRRLLVPDSANELESQED